jgi:Family of unknown function (DUF5946)
VTAGACDECGWSEAGGREGCRARFEAFLARDFSDARYFQSHRLLVDAYCLQHPEQFCASAKSLAAHLAGLGWIVEQGAATAVGPEALRRWLSGTPRLDKPPLPERRGATTIGDLPAEAPPAEWGEAVRGWAECIWSAYEPLHPVARRWIEAARSGAVRPAGPPGSGRSSA